MGRMRIRAHHQLARAGIAFRHDRVADALAARTVRQLAVEPDAVFRAEGLLGGLQPLGHGQQAHGAMLGLHAVVQEGQVVAEGQDAGGLPEDRLRSQGLLQEAGGHGRHVLVAEAPVRLHEEAVSGPHGGQPHRSGGCIHHGVPRQQFLGVGHGPRLGPGQRRHRLAPEAGGVVGEKAATAHDLGGDGIQPRREFQQRNGLAPAEPRDQAEVRAGEQAQVLGVLAVDALEAFGDDQADSCAEFGIGAGFAAAALAPALPGHAHLETPGTDGALLHGEGLATLQAQVGEVAQLLVEVVADEGRRDLVGADLVTQGEGLV